MIKADLGGGFLSGVRVIELANELGEYAGKVFAGLGADVVKVEPLGGEETRSYGPFYQDKPDPNRSLYFWHYNYGKRGVMLDLDAPSGIASFKELLASADVLLVGRPASYLEDRGLTDDAMKAINPQLIVTRVTPFWPDGPWAKYKASDLIHLALGGVMMNCGYDPNPLGQYETPPIAPQMWHAYHVAGEMACIQTIAALIYRMETGVGQPISIAVHDAVAKNTETDLPDWIYSRQTHYRQTCCHSFPAASLTETAPRVPGISRTKDGRWLYPYRTYLPGFALPFEYTVELLRKYNCLEDLGDPKYLDLNYLQKPEVGAHVSAVIDRCVSKYGYSAELWRAAQDAGMPWAPVRLPEENAAEEHWAARSTFANVEYPEIGESFLQTHAKWECPEVPWAASRRAPLLNEHYDEIFAEQKRQSPSAPSKSAAAQVMSKHGKPFALTGLRVLDLSWLLASGGAGRFFTALGAEVLKVEHSSRVDGMRLGTGFAPEGGREERDAATGPIWSKHGGRLNRSGSFMEINAGKRSLSLNLKHARGKEILTKLVEQADIIIEGFSPGTMDRMGFGYDRLKEINPRIVYVQQSGLGQIGTYGRLRSYGPTAQAFSGLSEMSGLPQPYPPAGIGYSYLDWFGAYQMALGMMAGLYRQRKTGRGCWIDSSQVEAGLFLTGTAVLDHSANGRSWTRFGNRSPYKRAAPHGAYPAAGNDRWIAIAAFDDAEWRNLLRVLKLSPLAADPKLLTLDLRLAHQDYLDKLIGEATAKWDAFTLMEALQTAGVTAGVCQTAQDRCEHDPDLAHGGWLVELAQSEIGTWPVKEVPGKFGETPAYVGGVYDRSGPSYAEDNAQALKDWLGLDEAEHQELEQAGIL